MNKKKFSKFNDGVAKIYREKDRRTNFSAKVNVSVLDDMDFVVRLDFQEMSKREQDLDFASQNDFTLSMKIKTRHFKDIDNKCKAVIDGYLYDIAYIDRTQTELFLYLEGIKKIDTRGN